MNTQKSTEKNNSLSQISSHTHFILERDNWYDYFPNKNACDRIFVELEKEEHKWILGFFLRDTTLRIEQKVRILQILTPHWYDLLEWFDTSKREEFKQFHFNPETCRLILWELWCLENREEIELVNILQGNEYLIIGCIRKEEPTPQNQKVLSKIREIVETTLHPNNLVQATKETIQDTTHASKREAKETAQMFRIYLERLLQKDTITNDDLQQAHQQAKDLIRLIILVPVFALPAWWGILYLLDKISKKMNISLMPSQSFEDDENMDNDKK